MITHYIQFQDKLKQIRDIANRASICPNLDDDLKEEAEYCVEILDEIRDYIRQAEIDELLNEKVNY